MKYIRRASQRTQVFAQVQLMLVYKGLCACEQVTPHVFVLKWKNTPHSSPHNQQAVGGVKQTHTCTHGPVYINWTAAVIWHRHTTVCHLLQTQTCSKDIIAAGMGKV